MQDAVGSERSRPSYPELIAVLAAAILGLTVQRPLAWLAGHQGINVLLAILVFATAVTIDPAALRRLASAWRSLARRARRRDHRAARALLGGVPDRGGRIAARRGLVVGLAPCEIASVATTAMAGGEAAVSAGVLIGSTVAAVALAGPILTLEAGHADVSPGGIIANLALVVALPLAVGLAARASAGRLAATRVLATPRAERVASRTALAAVAALVALIAAEVRLSAAYLAVAAALLALPARLGPGRPRPRRPRRPSRPPPRCCSPRRCATSRSRPASPPPPSARPPPPPSASTASPSWSGAPRWPASCASAPPARPPERQGPKTQLS